MPIKSPVFSRRDRGAVLLVTLCFVAVLAIILGSYIAVCNRAMQLSNRSYQTELSRQLAEAGIEEALRAFNKNDWSDWSSGSMTIDWTLDTTNKRATAAISFPAAKFGQGATATVKLRVDNYDAAVLGSTWSSTTNYRVGDTVGYNGIFYQCVKNHLNQAPNGSISNFWAPDGPSWAWNNSNSYTAQQMVCYNGFWYRCISTNSNSPPPGTASSDSNWTYIPAVTKDTTTGVFGVQDAVVNWYGTWYRYNSGWDSSPAISWRWRSSGMVYRFNDTVCYSNVWYRYTSSTPTNTTSTYSAPSSDTSRWSPFTNMWSWSSSNRKYNSGDMVYYSTTGQWYRCILAHTSSGSINPATATYWSNTPSKSNAWSAGIYYAANDLVAHNGVWYICILTHTSSTSITPANATYWIGADTTTAGYKWNVTTAYTTGDYKCYEGAWYKCLSSNTGQPPSNTTYWTATWAQSSGLTTGAPLIIAESIITLGDNTTSRTQLRAPIFLASLFPSAIGSTTTLNITGGTGTIDSYNSTLGTSYLSQVGTSTNYSAVVAAGSAEAAGTSTLLSIGNGTTVSGYASSPSSTSSPYAPRASFGSSTIVKSATSPVSPGVDLSRVSRSPYVPQFSPWPTPSLATAFTNADFPAGLALSTNPTGTVTIGSAGSTTPAIYFFNGSLDIENSGSYDIATLAINGPVVLYVNGNFRLRTGGSVIVRGTGSLEVHANGGIRIDEASNGIDNQTLDPQKVFLLSDSSGTTTQYYADTTNPFYGVIYAPNTTATLGVDIRTGVTIYGAISARKITFSNEANLHYDTALRYATFGGVDQPYTVTQWREIPVTERATMP